MALPQMWVRHFTRKPLQKQWLRLPEICCHLPSVWRVVDEWQMYRLLYAYRKGEKGTMGSRKKNTNESASNRKTKAEDSPEQRAAATSGNPTHSTARSLQIAEAGVKTGQDFAGLMSALMSDVIEGRISPVTANSAVNAGGKLLKMIEMQYKYGREDKQESDRQDIMLTS